MSEFFTRWSTEAGQLIVFKKNERNINQSVGFASSISICICTSHCDFTSIFILFYFIFFRRPLEKAEKERLRKRETRERGTQKIVEGDVEDDADIRDEVKKDAKMMTGSPRMQ